MYRSKTYPNHNYNNNQTQNNQNKRKYNEIENSNYEEEEKRDKVMVVDNHIYFYSDVNTESILELNRCIYKLNKDLLIFKNNSKIEYGLDVNDICIYLHINSLGGYVTDAFSGVDTIIKSEIPIYSIVEGYAASAATFLSIVCRKRFMTRHSTLLIHQLSGGYWGTYQQMNDNMLNNKYLQKQIKQLYMENSKGKIKKERLEELLKRDLMLNFKKCRKMGLVDELV